MPSLKQDHLELYRRVRLKGILHLILGMLLVLFPNDPADQSGAVSSVQHFIGQALTLFGFIYLFFGVIIIVGLFRARATYRFLRAALTAACIFNTIWLLLLITIVVQKPTRGIAYITAIYAYLVYNMWYIRYDSGWGAIAFLNKPTTHKIVEKYPSGGEKKNV